MNRPMKVVLLVGGLAVGAVVALEAALATALDSLHYCDTGFSKLATCTYHQSWSTTRQSTPIFNTPSSTTDVAPSESGDRLLYSDTTSWAIASCPENRVARRLLCATSPLAGAEEPVTGLPRPRPWLLTTTKNSTLIRFIHVETPLDLAATLRFYRDELSKRGWTENDGAAVEPDAAAITFTTADGPALLRLVHQDDRTLADLWLHKPFGMKASIAIPPRPEQARLLLGNTTDEEAVITINEQTIKLAARAGLKATADPETARKDGPEINLPPGKYRVTLKVASGAVQNREFELAAGETWGLLAGQAGIPLPLQIY